MKDLEERLRKLFENYVDDYNDFTGTIAEVKKAFDEAGWQTPGGGLRGSLMTGQEFYDRFDKEWAAITTPARMICSSEDIHRLVLEAARRAAGVSDD